MTTGIFITARLGSKRLERKHLLEAGGRPLLACLIGRIGERFAEEIGSGAVRIVITTSDEPANRDFEPFSGKGLSVFYGSISNIPLRHLQAAEALGIEKIIAVDGDDILASVEGMRLLFEELEGGAEYVRTTGLPLGMNSFGYSARFLKESLDGYGGPGVLETGWGKIFDEKRLVDVDLPCPGAVDGLRFTLDYEDDFRFFRAVIEGLGDDIMKATDEEIIGRVVSERLFEINAHVSKEYWDNFNRNMAMESGGLNRVFQEKAHRYIPAGAHTYSRADDCYPENAPPVLERGKGAYVWDLEGNRYLDFGMALRAVTVGYGYERIDEAAIEEIRKGNNLTRASRTEIEAAEAISGLIPWVEMVKFAKNGSTVTTAAVKLARAHTGRKYVAKCAEHPFFTYDDWFIGDTDMSAGVPDEHRSLTLNFNYNDVSSLEALFDKDPEGIAAVILEPATTEEPKDGFLQRVKGLCRKNGAVLILDEMITGFRWHLQGASKYYGVEPDLVTYGKGMANGFSVAALGGRREIMELGGIRHSGERVFLISTTHGAEMCGLGAFMETMKVYRELDVVGRLWSSGGKLIEGFNDIARELGISERFGFTGVPCSPGFTTLDADGKASLEFRTLFVQEMIRNGVLMPWVAISYSHGDDEISAALDAGRKSLGVYRRALEDGVERYLEGRAIKPVFRPRN